MPYWYTLSVVGVVILAVVLLIVRFKVNPVIGLVIGAVAIGLLTGLGPVETVDTVAQGFGDVMLEAGLLIAWGVLIGALLNEMGAITRLVDMLLKTFGKRGVPYALGLSFGTFLQTIFIDVLIVMAAPLARKIAPRLGKTGTGVMATTFAISLEAGIVLMVPGFAAVTLAGLLKVPLGIMMLGGLAVVVPTILIAITIMRILFRMGFWNERDEIAVIRDEAGAEAENRGLVAVAAGERGTRRASGATVGAAAADAAGRDGGLVVGDVGEGAPLTVATPSVDDEGGQKQPPLILLFGPMLLSLVLIATQAVLTVLEIDVPVFAFLGAPTIALLIGVIGTALLARRFAGSDRVEAAFSKGFKDAGQILVLTGVGGSLAAVVAAGDLGEILKGMFQASTFAPLLVVWGMAAVLHVAVGSVTLSAITAAGILAPVVASTGLNPLLLALAAGAGALFCIHVTSNTFWLLQSLLGQTVRGALKSVTFGVSLASVVALGMVLVLSLFIH